MNGCTRQKNVYVPESRFFGVFHVSRLAAAVTFAGCSSGLNGAVVAGGPGRSTLTVALNKRTRDAIRRANVRLTVRITVIDGAGNRSRQTRVLRSQTLGQRRG